MQTISATANQSAAMTADTAAQKQVSTSVTKDSQTEATPAVTEKTAATESVALSSRAQKIQKLNEEFFPSGPKSLQITSTFIERLHEYGLINDSEADRLSTAVSAAEDSSPNQLKDLTLFIGEFSEQLKKDTPTHSLIDTLDRAKSIIDQLDAAKPSAINIKGVIAELSQYRNSEEAKSLSDAEYSSLTLLEASLTIADKLSPETASSEKINHYLKIFNQS